MPARCFDAQVFSRTQVAPAIHRLTVRWPETVPMPHAGQFCMLRAWGRDEAPLLSRPISVHEAYPIRGDEPICENGQLLQLVTFLFEVKGRGTGCLAQLEAGDTLQITGPAGNGFDFSGLAKDTKVALVGGGIGTAPLYQAARELAAMGIRADVYYGFRDEPYEMEPYRHTAGVVRVATDSGRVGFHGFVTQMLKPEEYDLVVCCGPEVMMRRVAAMCAQQNTRCLVSLEKKMACGIGACLGCTCKTKSGEGKSVCKHGPVFDAKEVFE